MGVFGACTRCCFAVSLVVALLVGWIASQEHPVAVIFQTLFRIQGLGKPQTDEVPADLKPAPRPEGELFLSLPGGDQMPANGLGMCCRPTAYDDVSVYRTVLWYLLQGGRHVDTAALYLNHAAVGRGIRDAVARGVPRGEIFLTTKVWPDSFGYNSTLEKVPRMLDELGVDYIDLVLMHAPRKLHPRLLWNMKFGGEDEFTTHECKNQLRCREDTWRALSAFRDQGKIRNLGVSNFNIQHMKEIQALGLAPIAAHQLQFHPWAPQWLRDIISYCHQHRIAVTGYFSLGGHDNKDKAMDMEVLSDIAKAHGKRPAQILLRWSLQKNISIIPGTGKPTHMKENLGTYGFELSGDDMARIETMSDHPISKDFFFFDF